ncbi:MAG: glycerate kinase [Cyclobacteriaceae bacterium]|nr:glycerate kinase [Cyclobacteriaceae bacterium]
MKILIAPDKFKGTLTAAQVCNAIEQGLLRSGLNATIWKFPLADGGEGTLDIFLQHKNGKLIEIEVYDPLMREIKAGYVLSEDGTTAFIEMASASGLALLKPKERKPLRTTTFGTGQMIKDALEKGAQQIILGVGGSATNDAALGALVALGAKITDQSGDLIFPVGESLKYIVKIELQPVLNLIESRRITAICDVDNPFYGSAGAAFTYAPQKGADEGEVQLLDIGLHHLADLLLRDFKIDLQQVSGSGAGGGFAGGIHALMGAALKRGTDVVFDITNFKQAVAWADVVITGEGKLDSQTMKGKLVQGVVAVAQKFKKPVYVICGECQFTEDQFRTLKATAVFSLVNSVGKEAAMTQTGDALSKLAELPLAKSIKKGDG